MFAGMVNGAAIALGSSGEYQMFDTTETER
jgi:hypothetical protein